MGSGEINESSENPLTENDVRVAWIEVLWSDEEYDERLDHAIYKSTTQTRLDYLEAGKYEELIDILRRMEHGVFQ